MHTLQFCVKYFLNQRKENGCLFLICVNLILNDIELDFGADHEKTENLEEHVTSKYSPWHLDYSWSKEAKKLRELAVKSPWLIDDNFILSFFKTLRICDKNVSKTLLAAIM